MTMGAATMARLHFVLIGLLVGTGAAAPTSADPPRTVTVAVAAAADLRFALDEVLAELRLAQPAVEAEVSYGASGNLYAQLANGAPFDLFLSADTEYPRRLVEQGLALDDGVFSYAVGRIVVWVPRGTALDWEAHGMAALTDPSVRRIAIANPSHAPYGRAAEAALRSLGVYEALQPKLVLGENVAQAAQFVESGAADAGIIGLAAALSPRMRAAGRYWVVPPSAYPRIEQAGVILKRTREVGAARALRDFLLGPRGRALLQQHGFGLPGE
jgi:molybdate transport system substrate-binding protein